MQLANKSDVFQLIDSQKDKFMQLSSEQVDFKQECLFAKQLISKSDFAINTAKSNPASLQAAILNVAAIGISLNPALAHAYLVPRDKQICLDLSYKGLVKLATDAGAIKWAKAVLVYEQDTFLWKGPCEMPEHSADPFSKDRGNLKGGYCIAKLPDGETLVDTMSADEIDKIKRTSKAKNGPWKDWFEEMAKKTLIKRAFKSWPQTENDRLATAMAVSHESEGTAFTLEEKARFDSYIKQNNGLEMFFLSKELTESAWIALYNSFDKGTIVKNKENVNELEKDGRERFNSLLVDMAALVEDEDVDAILEILNECTEWQRGFILASLPPAAENYCTTVWENDNAETLQ